MSTMAPRTATSPGARRRRIDDDGGFSLVELLVVIVLTGIIGIVVLTSVVQTLGISAAATTRVDALTELQRVQERISRNVRAADPIEAATATSLTITVYDDVDQRREITYTFAGDTLTQRQVTYPNATAAASSDTTGPLVQELVQGATPVFTYTDATGAAWTAGSTRDIAQVRITLIGQADGDTVRITTSANVRNRG